MAGGWGLEGDDAGVQAVIESMDVNVPDVPLEFPRISETSM